jgi:chromosome segregation ATPase
MDKELIRYKSAEEDENNRKIEDAIEKIFEDKKLTPFAASVCEITGLHRNTAKGDREWHLTRPLKLGDDYLVAGRLITLKDLLGIIKQHRSEKKERRTKSQLRQAEDLTEELGGMETLLANMMDDNADLMREIDDLKSSIKRKQEIYETTVFGHSEYVRSLKEEIERLKDEVEELKKPKRQSKSGSKASISIVKPRTDGE